MIIDFKSIAKIGRNIILDIKQFNILFSGNRRFLGRKTERKRQKS